MKLLILHPHALWTQKTSLARRHSTLAILRHPEVDALLSGPGWHSYDSARSLAENIARIMPDADAIYWYKPLGSREAPAILSPQRRTIPAVIAFNEAWWPEGRADQEVRDSGSDLVVCHHENDLDQFGPLRHVVHLPHCAERSLFAAADRPDTLRTSAILTGTLNASVYPLRTRLADLMFRRVLPGYVRPHPGYRLPGLAAIDRQASEYAQALGGARLFLYCTSRYKYALSKIVEAAMAGCVLVGDVAHDSAFTRSFGQHVVRVDGLSDAAVRERVRWWLDHDRERQQRASDTHFAAMQHTQEHYADRFVAALRGVL